MFKLEKSCFIYPNVTIYHKTIIDTQCIIHAGVVMGRTVWLSPAEGNEWFKIPQIGGVHNGNNVEIGANSTIDEALDNTTICDGVKLDNQVQVAHSMYIGENTAVAGCVGIAGSAVMENCAIGGGAGIQITFKFVIIRMLQVCRKYRVRLPNLVYTLQELHLWKIKYG